MSEDFIAKEGAVLVRDQRQGFRPVKTPDCVTDEEFRNAVAAAYTIYRLEGRLPSAEDLYKMHPKILLRKYSELMLTEAWETALRYRGIEWDEEAGLNLEQQHVLLKLQDYTDRRSLGVKLRELGVPMPRFQAWLKQPLFAQYYREIGEHALQEAVAPALSALAGKAAAGEDRAIEKVLEISGRWNPNAMAVENARVVVTAMVEAVVKHVKDPEVRQAIMSEVSLAAGTMKSLNP